MDEELRFIIKKIKYGTEEEANIGATLLWNYMEEKNSFKHALYTIKSELAIWYFGESRLEDIKSEVFNQMIKNRLSGIDEDLENANFQCIYTYYVQTEMNKEFANELSLGNKNNFARQTKIKHISSEYNIPIKKDNAWLFEKIINTKDAHVKNKKANATIKTCLTAINSHTSMLIAQNYEDLSDSYKSRGVKC